VPVESALRISGHSVVDIVRLTVDLPRLCQLRLMAAFYRRVSSYHVAAVFSLPTSLTSMITKADGSQYLTGVCYD